MKKILVAASTLLMLSSPMLVHAQDTVDITYQHVTKNTLSTEQQNTIQTDRLIGVATETETIVLVYEKDKACLINNPNEKVPNKPGEQPTMITGMLPKTGEAISYSLLVGTGVLLGAVWLFRHKKTRAMMALVLVGVVGIGQTASADVQTLVPDVLQRYDMDSVFSYNAKELDCYHYVGFIRTPRPNKPVKPVVPPVTPPTTPVTPTPPVVPPVTPPTPPTPPTVPVTPTEEKKGSVIAKFVDEQGNAVQDDVIVADKVAVGSAYTATKPDKITAKDGKVYTFKEIKADSASETGKVTEDTQTVTYVYTEVKGSVIATFVDEQGNTVQDDVIIADKESVGSAYTATKPDKITTADGKVYTFKEIKADSASETGKVTEDTQTVTYVYTEVKGSVVVKYVNEAGDEIKDMEIVLSDKSVGTDYDTTSKKVDVIGTTDGKVYRFKQVKLGTEIGKVTEGTQEVVYEYRLQAGTVIVKHIAVDENGADIEVLKTETVLDDTVPVGMDYATEPAAELEGTDKIVYVFKQHRSSSAAQEGQQTTENQVVVYEYVPTGQVIARFWKYKVDGERMKDDVVVQPEKTVVGTTYTVEADAVMTKNGEAYEFYYATVAKPGKPTVTVYARKDNGKVQKGVIYIDYVYRNMGDGEDTAI